MQATKPRRTAPEIIGIHLGWDMAEVSDGRYQSTAYARPAIYVCGEHYFAAPADNRPPKAPEGDWQEVGEYHGRKVFRLVVPPAPKAAPGALAGFDGHAYQPRYGHDGWTCETCGRAKARHRPVEG